VLGVLLLGASCKESAQKKAKQKRIDDSLKQVRVKDSLKKVQEDQIRQLNTPSNLENTIEKKLKTGTYFLRLLHKVPELEKKINNEEEQYTLFIPSDSIFKVFITNKKTDTTNTVQIKSLLENHIISAHLSLIDLMSSNEVITLSQKKLSVQIKDKKIYLQNAQVLNSDILYNSGILHSINQVIY
jgi:uncharacterized surface protein with fasciclin (FAS1) repeats